MRPITVSVGPLGASSATNIRTASTGSAGALTFTGSPVTVPGFYVTPNGQKIAVSTGQALMSAPQQVVITAASNETATVTLSGLDGNGNPISEVVQLGNAGTYPSVLSYAVLTGAVLSANSAGNLSIGTNGVATTPWVSIDAYGWSNISIQCNVTGTVNYTVQSTLDDPNDPTNPVAVGSMTWVNSSDTNVVGATGTEQTNYFFVPKYIRCLLNSGSGTVTMTVIQAAGVE